MTEIKQSLKSLATQFTLEERKKLCNTWVKTNLSKSEFIRQNNLPYSFFAWCKKLLINTPLTTAKSSTSDRPLTRYFLNAHSPLQMLINYQKIPIF